MSNKPEETTYEEGWLDKILEQAGEEVKKWPRWKRSPELRYHILSTEKALAKTMTRALDAEAENKRLRALKAGDAQILPRSTPDEAWRAIFRLQDKITSMSRKNQLLADKNEALEREKEWLENELRERR